MRQINTVQGAEKKQSSCTVLLCFARQKFIVDSVFHMDIEMDSILSELEDLMTG